MDTTSMDCIRKGTTLAACTNNPSQVQRQISQKAQKAMVDKRPQLGLYQITNSIFQLDHNILQQNEVKVQKQDTNDSQPFPWESV